MNIKEKTYKVIADRLIEKVDSTEYVEWAVDLISKGFDSENLLILAGLDNSDSDEREHYFNHSLKDLNIDYPINLKVTSDMPVIFSQTEVIDDLIIIGFGNRFLIYDLLNNSNRFETSFKWYFGSFYIDGEDIFVASESSLLKITLTGRLQWTAKSLGIDGVVISEISESAIYGEGEWDPPGGWKPFVIKRKTGFKKY